MAKVVLELNLQTNAAFLCSVLLNFVLTKLLENSVLAALQCVCKQCFQCVVCFSHFSLKKHDLNILACVIIKAS